MSFTANGVRDNDPYPEEPDDAKVSRPVREWGGSGYRPADHNYTPSDTLHYKTRVSIYVLLAGLPAA
jgi:hypothetical protein